MALVSDLFGTMNGTTIAIAGGGCTTLDDLEQCQPDVVIAVNHHLSGLLNPDYVCALDEITYSLMRYDDPITIGQFAWCDYLTHDNGRALLKMAPFRSAFKATEVALKMGADAVYLCGIDCFSGERPYQRSDYEWDDYLKDKGERARRNRRELDQRICMNRWNNVFSSFEQVKPVSEFLRLNWDVC